jgi:hypothetical protein
MSSAPILALPSTLSNMQHRSYYQNRPLYYQKSNYIINTGAFIIKNINIIKSNQSLLSHAKTVLQRRTATICYRY